jgi:hypothetical protein
MIISLSGRQRRGRQRLLWVLGLLVAASCSQLPDDVIQESSKQGDNGGGVSMDAAPREDRDSEPAAVENGASADGGSSDSGEPGSRNKPKSSGTGGAGGRSMPAANGGGTGGAGTGGAGPGGGAGGAGTGGAGTGGAGTRAMSGPPTPAPAPPRWCPRAGEVRMTWHDEEITLPGNGADFLPLLVDGSCPDSPPLANDVSARVVLHNSGNRAEAAECWLASAKSQDYVQVSVPARSKVHATLAIVNRPGGSATSSLTTLSCRNATNNPTGSVTASWMKLLSEAGARAVDLAAP